MTDIEVAINHLGGHSICLCRNGMCFADDGRGISPMLKFISEGREMTNYSAADLIVGKAVAMLFVKSGIVCVYGKVMSESGKKFLETHGIPCTYETLIDKIVNRQGTDICPMEKTVKDINDIDKGYEALVRKWNELLQSNHYVIQK